MKKRYFLLYIIISFIIAIPAYAQENVTESRTLRDIYLRQKPPGVIPELFAPDVISRSGYFEHSAALFSTNGKEVYWTAKPDNRRNYKIYFMKMAISDKLV